MNILYLTNHLDIGGITSYILTLTEGLTSRGHHIYVASSAGGLREQLQKKKAGYFYIPIRVKNELHPQILLSFFKLLPKVKEKDIDIIHANSRVTQVLASLLSRATGRPYIFTCHGFFKKKISRIISPCWGRRVIAVSEEVKAHLKEDFRAKEEIIRVINNGIDINKFKVTSPNYKAQIKKEMGLSYAPLIGIVARLSDVKGHVYLIRAMPEIIKSIPAAQLLIAGDGKMKKELVELAQNLGIMDKVFFIPAGKDTERLLSALDVFVLPSLKEGLGLSLMEAMACGLAVVGSDVGGIRSLIKTDETGILVGPKDTHAIASAVIGLLKDVQKREKLGDNARSFIRNHFPQEGMVLETERIYLECLKEKG
ncbi:MAG: glycosyltransferase family 4 protein [Candidatus Omnitrophica bacterium]|nr:glycosyltransferase family 4 protein [Candidatus Omnitrophota bacterium]